MNNYEYFAVKLSKILDSENIEKNECMKKHTSFKVGGPVDLFATPVNYIQVVETIKLCKKENIPYFIVGNGSNLLVKDGGIRGVVIKLSKLNSITVEEDEITAQSGATLALTSKAALDASLTGLEFACGIPGSVGGALTMNAGAYDGEMSHCVERALVVDEKGNIKTLSKDELELGYRMSAIMKYGYTVLEVTFKLKHGDHDKIKDRMDELTRRRKEKQPLEYPSAGSTFKRPKGSFASKLIQESGLKGLHVGDAEVSIKHSGFIINKGNASAKDILDLIHLVQGKVKEKFGVDLYTEVVIIGEDVEEDEENKCI